MSIKDDLNISDEQEMRIIISSITQMALARTALEFSRRYILSLRKPSNKKRQEALAEVLGQIKIGLGEC